MHEQLRTTTRALHARLIGPLLTRPSPLSGLLLTRPSQPFRSSRP